MPFNGTVSSIHWLKRKRIQIKSKDSGRGVRNVIYGVHSFIDLEFVKIFGLNNYIDYRYQEKHSFRNHKS